MLGLILWDRDYKYMSLFLIHSFTLAISIAPLQVHYYSEALPTQHGYFVGVSRRSATGNCEWRTCLGPYVLARAEIRTRDPLDKRCWIYPCATMPHTKSFWLHSFRTSCSIHWRDVLRSTHNSSLDKKIGFRMKIKLISMRSRQQAELLRETIPNPSVHHRDCAVLHSCCMGKQDHQNPISAERTDRLPRATTPVDIDHWVELWLDCRLVRQLKPGLNLVSGFNYLLFLIVH